MTLTLGALLVVDDDEHNRDVLCRRLERKEYAIEAHPIVKTQKSQHADRRLSGRTAISRCWGLIA